MKFLVCICLAAAAVPAMAAPLVFERIHISERTYESAAAFDVNHDGVLDIYSGAYWYEGPDFKKDHKVCELEPIDTYYDDFSNYPMDVNGDGYLDIVTGGWFGKSMSWRENPKGQPVEWTTHQILETGNVERPVFYDLDGDGQVEVIPVPKPLYVLKLQRDDKGLGKGAFDISTIECGPGGHGLGAGDVNGDGKPDIVEPDGWCEAPAGAFSVEGWTWHQEFKLGSASVPILVFDVNEDGMNDLIVGEAHNYGLYWMEQGKDSDGNRTWARHDIEMTCSQYHDLQLHDMDNDGKMELVTGKRYHAHNGHDPGGNDPVGTYYFKINKGNFERVTLDYGPADSHSGVGIYFWVEDVDGNGWKDIVAPGKEGLYLFKNMGPAKQ